MSKPAGQAAQRRPPPPPPNSPRPPPHTHTQTHKQRTPATTPPPHTHQRHSPAPGWTPNAPAQFPPALAGEVGSKLGHTAALAKKAT